MEIFEAAQQLKVELSRHLSDAATPSKGKQTSILAGENLREYFTLVGDSNLSIPWSVGDLMMYSEGDFDKGQIGFRWYPRDYGSSAVLNVWHANWLVLGQRDGDPMIFDQETGVVMTAVRGGVWEPVIIAPSVADFVGILAVWVRVAIGEFQENFTNENSDIQPELMARLAENLQFLPQLFRDNFLNTLDT